MTNLPPNLKRRLEAEDQYIEALGNFVHAFARIEGILALALRVFSGVTGPIARAIFHGVRVDAAVNYIRRILEVTNAPADVKADFELAFTHLGDITRARNDILHYGVGLGTIWRSDDTIIESSPMIVTNKDFALTEDRIRETPVSAEILEQMMEDLDVIRAILFGHILLASGRKDDAKRFLGPARKHAWRYKPPRQSSHHGPRPPKPRKPRRPRRPSRE
jgi:hypothetical protein